MFHVNGKNGGKSNMVRNYRFFGIFSNNWYIFSNNWYIFSNKSYIFSNNSYISRVIRIFLVIMSYYDTYLICRRHMEHFNYSARFKNTSNFEKRENT